MDRIQKLLTSTLAAGLGFALSTTAEEVEPLYQNDFENAEVGSVPEDFLVLNGEFTLQAEGGNQFVELPGTPLDSFGALFGPTKKDGVTVLGRAYGTRKGRLFPSFGIGLNGVGGFKLMISPAKRALELMSMDEVLKSSEYKWESATWTHLKLQVLNKEGKWMVRGKAWPAGEEEPDWTLEAAAPEEPYAGKAAIWCSPYSGNPIRFDDLTVFPAKN